MIRSSNEADPISIRIWGKNRSFSANKFTFSVRCRIEEELANAALTSNTRSQAVRSIDISLNFSQKTSPNPPFISTASRINKSVGAGLELSWLIDNTVDEPAVRVLMGRPLLGLLLGVFKRFKIPEVPYLKSLRTYPAWSEIIDSLPISELEFYARCASDAPISIDDDACWALIENSKRSSSSNKQQEEHMIRALSKLSADDIREFAAFFQGKMLELYRWDLWAIGYILNDGCSDDGFKEFRAWLICQGREFFEQAVIRPEFVGERVQVGAMDAHGTLYGFDLIAGRVYEEKTGFEMNNAYPREPLDPVGDEWDEDELPSIYPALCRKFSFR